MREFQNYTERLGQYFIANDIADDTQIAVVLVVVGPTTYAVLKILIAPYLPHTKSLADLQTAFKNHYGPKPLVIAERF